MEALVRRRERSLEGVEEDGDGRFVFCARDRKGSAVNDRG